jgi:hypothetical protein
MEHQWPATNRTITIEEGDYVAELRTINPGGAMIFMVPNVGLIKGASNTEFFERKKLTKLINEFGAHADTKEETLELAEQLIGTLMWVECRDYGKFVDIQDFRRIY